MPITTCYAEFLLFYLFITPKRWGHHFNFLPIVEVSIDTFVALHLYCFSSYILIFAVYFKISLDFKHFFFLFIF